MQSNQHNANMQRGICLILTLLALLFCLTGCKKDPVAAEREAMEKKYDVNGADPYHIRNPGGFNVWIYEKIARKLMDDGWVFTFEQYGSKTGDDNNLCRYSFSGFNLRYRYDDAYIQAVIHNTDGGVTIRERRIPAVLDWGYGSPAQQRDRELIAKLLPQVPVALTLSAEDAPCEGGFLLMGGSYEKDCSLNALMAELRLSEETNAARILFS